MKQKLTVLLVCCLSMLLFAGMASAHVVVYPSEAKQGGYEKFIVRVPTEEKVATTSIQVKIPETVEISRVEPKPDWKYEFEKDSSDKVISITWTATGAGIGESEFGEFSMQGKVGKDATEIIWKAYQTYADGKVVEWTESGETANYPASVTKVIAGSGSEHGTSGSHSAAEGSQASNGGNEQTALYVAIAALAVALVSIIISVMKRTK
jgi:uncharacterized protein YcnI